MNKNTTAVLASYQARRTKNQKAAFAQHVCSAASECGFTANVETTKNRAKNIVVGDVKNASVVYTAHYDTASVSFVPNFIFPKAPILTKLYQIAVALAMLVPSVIGYVLGAVLLPAVITAVPKSVGALVGIILAAAAFVVAIRLVLCGKACENTANANTSGVATLFEIMAKLPAEYKNKTAFVFLDLQENGCIGAADFAKKHKHLKKNKALVLNFDSVGVGDHFVVATKKADSFLGALNAAFASKGNITATVMKGGKRIPSDHNKFKCSAGVSAFEQKGDSLSLVIKSDGTDTVYKEENIEFASDAGVLVAKYLFNPATISEAVKEEVEAAPEAAVAGVEEAKTAEAEVSAAEEATEAAEETVAAE